jgi:iron complex outermembrane receptor protein
LPENETETLALFALQEVSAGPVRLEFGGRYDTTDVSVGSLTTEYQDRVVAAGCSVPQDTDFDAFSASAGAIWLTDNGYGVGGSVTRAVRSPSVEELLSCGPHLATQSFEVGNVDLEEETGLALDISLRKRTGKLTGEVTLFINRFDDYIYEEFTGNLRNEDGDLPSSEGLVLPEYRFTQADAEFYGAELRAGVVLFSNESHHVGLDLTGDLVRAELRDSNEKLPRIPAARYGIGIHYRGDSWYASASVRHTDEQTRLAPSETIREDDVVVDPGLDPTFEVEGLDLLGGPTDDYTLVQATVGYRMVRGGLLHDFSLRGTNLTDEEARVHTSRLKNVAPLPGADVSFAYRLVF